MALNTGPSKPRVILWPAQRFDPVIVRSENWKRSTKVFHQGMNKNKGWSSLLISMTWQSLLKYLSPDERSNEGQQVWSGAHCSKTYIVQTLRDQSSIVIPQNLGIEDPSANVCFTWVQLKVWSRAAFPVEWRRITLAMLQDPRGPCSKVATPNGCSSATKWQYKSAQKAIPNFFLWMLLDPNHSSQNPSKN